MAYVNEDTSESDQQLINFNSLKDPQTGSRTPGLPRWTIDRERDSFLMWLGGGDGPDGILGPSYFLFCLKGSWIRLSAIRIRGVSDDPMFEKVTWKISHVFSPDAQLPPLIEILSALREAFVAFGRTGTRRSHSRVKDVVAEIPDGISIEHVTGSRELVFYVKTYPKGSLPVGTNRQFAGRKKSH